MSEKNNNQYWKCPLGETLLLYGTTCNDTEKCEDKLNVNAKHYLDVSTRKRLEKKDNTRGLGISEISNEGNT